MLNAVKDLGNIKVNASEIFRTESSTTRLPPFGRLMKIKQKTTFKTIEYELDKNHGMCS